MTFVFIFFLVVCFFKTDTVFSIFEFECAPYRVTGDKQATIGIAIPCRVWVCPGQTIEATLCGNSFGDNFLRLYEGGVETASNDDYCGQYGAARLIYTFPYDNMTECREFQLHQGCYGFPLCYGTSLVSITGEGFGHPTGQPSSQPSGEPSGEPTSPTGQPSAQPSQLPSSAPSSIPTYKPPTALPSFIPSAEPTGQPTDKPTNQPSSHPSEQPSGEPSGLPSCQPLSVPSSQPTSEPSSPSGQPSGQPSDQPSGQPSMEPSSIPSTQPTAEPTAYGSTSYCPSYNATGDDRARSDHAITCPIWACPGDTFIRLYDERGVDIIRNDDGPGCGNFGGSRMYYTATGKNFHPCHYYYLVQGCYNEDVCGGTAYVTILGPGHPTSVPSSEPSSQPSSSPSSPSAIPSGKPTGAPSTVPSSEPSTGTGEPSSAPSGAPSGVPSAAPTSVPTDPRPTSQPSNAPVVDETITIVITVMLPLCTLLVVLSVFFIYRYYSNRYTGVRGGLKSPQSHKVQCISSIPAVVGKHEDNLLAQIDIYEEF